MGNFVTTVGDVNRDGFSDIAIGASLFNNTQVDRGVVYIFHGSANGYSTVASTTINGPAFANSYFGCSVGAAGDVNGDGYSDIIIGAYGYSNGQAGEGYFSIHLGSATGVTVAAHLSVESNVASAQLGFSVAGAGDVNGDGYSDVIVGGNTYNSGTANEGKVFVYHGSSTGVDATADWSYETNTAEKLGSCVAGVGDVNGDGYSDVLALSSEWSNGETNEGRYFYFRGSATGLETTPGTVIETNVANAGLGPQSTSYIGDLNGDGYNDVVIGTSAYNNASTANEGALLIAYGAYPSLYFGSSQTIESNTTNYYLGNTVGFCGDVNGDGYNDIITGGPFYNGGLAAEGVARVYTGGASGVSSTPYYTVEPNVANTLFGSSVSAVGDCNGDGFSDIVVGANGYDNGANTDAGRTYIYMGNHALGVLGKSFPSRQYKSDLVTPVASSNGTFEAGCTFGISHVDKSWLGRASGKQVFEIRGHQDPFTNYASSMSTSVSFTGQQAAYTNLGLTGASMTYSVTVSGMGFPKWRTRTRYKITDALDGQTFGRWYYGSIHDKQDRSVKVNITCGVLPVELLSLKTFCNQEKKVLSWEVASDENIAQYKIWGSENGIDYIPMHTIEPGNGSYSYETDRAETLNYFRLEIIDNNLFSKTFDVYTASCNAGKNTLTAFPNPASDILNVRLNDSNDAINEIFIIDLTGKIVLRSEPGNATVNVSGLVSGIYHIWAYSVQKTSYFGVFSHL